MPIQRQRLTDLQSGANFISRHIGPREDEMSSMLKTVGASSLEDLMDKVIPAGIRAKQPLNLPVPLSERNALSDLRRIAGRNRLFTSMIGMGYYGCVTPKVILRNILESPGWYTGYTPYQAEVSQGRLEALLNFQQMVSDLTGLELASASLLDEGTAAAEAMAMAHRTSKTGSDVFFVDRDTHPQTLSVLETRARGFGFELVVGDPEKDLKPDTVFAALLSYPGSSGQVRDYREVMANLKQAGAMSIMATDLLSLCLLVPPGELGADVAIGSAQRFGVPMGYGGPHAAFFATHDGYKRVMPGRIIGVSVDAEGRPALRMALQTREQHIRREKATSNICTAQVLLAVIAGMFAVYQGPAGIRKIAARAHRWAEIAAHALKTWGYEVVTDCMFDTITVHVPARAYAIVAKAREQRINLRHVDADHIGISFDETTRRSEVERLLGCFKTDGLANRSLDQIDEEIKECIPEDLRRTSDYLTHPVFSLHQSETRMLRYLRQLQAKDIALDRSMIPLGSCTMKLNATTEMIPISWPDFAHMHPFVPLEQAQGYQQLFEELEHWLCEITGFDAVSLQPNAGSQGEYAGLMTIRAWHEANGEGGRDVCLIPSSAHGTNPASAVMAGLKVVVVKCDDHGNVDLADLRAKADEHSEQPCRPDGHLPVHPRRVRGSHHRNLPDRPRQWRPGLSRRRQPQRSGRSGAPGRDRRRCLPHEPAQDLLHPHGGGGPGVGPIGVKAHLARFLPGHRVVSGVNPASHGRPTIGQVSAAPWGSASILPISWAYIAMMGTLGLTRATQVAILNANYIARRLKDHFPIVYSSADGYVAHECIIDLRDLKEATGIGVEDVAKRLVDYGFHAPTMSWPVPETLMIEPTESEGQDEIDRFCEAMISIRQEIAELEEGKADAKDNVLRNAPHTHRALLADWTRPYSRERAFFPLTGSAVDKYWPPVARVDNVYGDRNLVCTCPAPEAYSDAAE
jgi:glycine dehydrogenase